LNTRTLRTPHNLGELSIKVQNFKVLDIKSILGAEYKPIEPSNRSFSFFFFVFVFCLF